jgi:hypothetical protein
VMILKKTLHILTKNFELNGKCCKLHIVKFP